MGYAVADLLLPEMRLPWEQNFGENTHNADSKQVMLRAPMGGTNYGNEFGRPGLAGFFRTLSCKKDGIRYGYHKPIMLAGGWGEIHTKQVQKVTRLPAAGGTRLVILGEPALRIGLGGSAMSSQSSSHAEGKHELDFASVQRDNAEAERRCADAIVTCAQLGAGNPILFVHDLGAGGLGNALAELLKDCDCGGVINMNKIPVADNTMSPTEVLVNESQERFLLAVDAGKLKTFKEICRRENVRYADIGETNRSKKICVRIDDNTAALDLPVAALFPKQKKSVTIASERTQRKTEKEILPPKTDLKKHATDILRLPAVACKSFLITIGDRSVGGLTVR